MPEETNTQEVQGTQAAPAQEKSFTEEEVNAIVQRRLERERRKYPGEEELSAFRSWKESQQTEKERWDSLAKERDEAHAALAAAQAELEQHKREKLLLEKGVPAGDVDYYAFKIGKLVTEETGFDKAAEKFLKEHAPQAAQAPERAMRVNSGAPLGGGEPPASTLQEYINNRLRGR